MMGLGILEDLRPTLFTERQRRLATTLLSDEEGLGGLTEKILIDDMIRG